jgi:hypothetical protein
MTNASAHTARRYPCEECPLLKNKLFRDFDQRELNFVSRFKRGELLVDKGAIVLAEGTRNPHLFTVLKVSVTRCCLTGAGRS